MPQNTSFLPDPRIEASSAFIAKLSLCQLRLQDDARWPWLVLVPEVTGVREIIDLTEADQALLLADIRTACARIKRLAGLMRFEDHKLNVANLGNIVAQLHVHVIARNPDDAAWPGPVWGSGTAVPFATAEKVRLITALRAG